MKVLQPLLSKGYFPKEVPPTFSTESFANVALSAGFVPDDVFVAPKYGQKLLKSAQEGVSRLCRHNLATINRTTRPLHVPHPSHFYPLCKSIDDGWKDISSHFGKSKISLSAPRVDPDTVRAFVPKDAGATRLERRIQDRAQGDYLVVTDVANCYGSIYSHSIPWALHTKATAKSKKQDLTLIGNLIDIYVRNGQDGQTIGIPVGTDTSFIIAELILTSVDEEIQTAFPNLKGFRFYDDYEIVCSDEQEASLVLSTMETSLSVFELSLNRQKTEIRKLPTGIDHLWLTELKKFSLEADNKRNPKQKRENLLDYANLVFNFAAKNPTEPILRYILATVLCKVDFTEIWNTYQSLLVQIYRSEPQLSHLFAHQLLYYKEKKSCLLDEKLLQLAISDHIARYSFTRATNEIVWALWLAIMFKVKLDPKIASILSSVTDNFVAILAFDAERNGLFPGGINKSIWEGKLIEDSIYSEDWLLAFEIPSQGWTSTKAALKYINSHDCFGALHNQGVRFYDPTGYQKTDILLKKLRVNSDFYAA